MGTSPSAVPAKRSAQVEGMEWEGEEEATGSTAKRRRREESHMTGECFSTACVSTLIMSCHSLTSSWSTRIVLGAHLLDRFMCVQRLVW